MIYGLGGGAVFTIWVTILFAFRGTEPFDKQGITLASVVLFYLLGGATGGLIAGALWPLTRWRAGAYLVGVLVAFVVATGLMYSLEGDPLRWNIAAVLTILTMTVIYGLYIGYHIWKYVRDG
jgi:MFS family permease